MESCHHPFVIYYIYLSSLFLAFNVIDFKLCQTGTRARLPSGTQKPFSFLSLTPPPPPPPGPLCKAHFIDLAKLLSFQTFPRCYMSSLFGTDWVTQSGLYVPLPCYRIYIVARCFQVFKLFQS